MTVSQYAYKNRKALKLYSKKGGSMTKQTFYTVVEQAGFIGERDVKTFASMTAAHRWMERWYGDDEIESLHVRLRRDRGEEREYI